MCRDMYHIAPKAKKKPTFESCNMVLDAVSLDANHITTYKNGASTALGMRGFLENEGIKVKRLRLVALGLGET